VEVKSFSLLAFAVALAVFAGLPATGGRSSAVALDGLYVKYQELGAQYYRDLRYDDARQAARAAYAAVQRSATPERVTRPLATLCAVETATFRFRQAAQICLDAQQRAEQFGDQSMMALGAFHLSNLYFSLGALDEAEAAMERTRSFGPVDPKVLSPALVLHHEARLAARRESPDRALPRFVEAANAAFAGGQVSAAAQIWNSAAAAFLESGNLGEAERLATESFRIRRLLDPAQLSSSLLFFAELRLMQGRPTEALHFAEEAFAARRRTRQPVFAFYKYRGMARLALGRLQEARADLEEAADAIRALRLTMAPADSLRQGSAIKHREVFQSLADVYANLFLKTGRREYAEKGFAAAAEGRAYAFRETSGELALVRERLTQDYFTTLERHRQAEETLFVRDSAEGRRTLAALRLRLTELELGAGLDAPAAAGPNSRPHEKPGEALLHFSLGARRSLLWTIADDRVWLSVLPARAQIDEAARAFRTGLENNLKDPVSGRRLHELLFSKLPPEIQKARRWRIVADGELNQIPFAAVEDQAGRYLVADHAIRMVPHAYSATGNEGEAWSGPAVAFGDPVYNPADGRQPGRRWVLDPQAPWLPRLPGTAREIQACSRLWGEQSKVYLGADVALEQIQHSLASRPGLLHFAMHMVPGPHNPAETRLALTVASDGTPRFLDPATIAAMNVHSRLVVLSGCRAGSGANVPGEGIVGLGRAWLLAGAGSVAATLWPVDDDSGEFLQAFYRSLNQSPVNQLPGQGSAQSAPEEALRQAQLAMLKSGTWRAQPRYWGAYFVMGRA